MPVKLHMNMAMLSMAFAVTGGAIGQLLMKSGMLLVPTILNTGFDQLSPAMLNFILLLGLGIGLYLLSMISWLVTLKHFSLNYAYPLLSLSYVLVYLLAAVWPGLHEPLTWNRTLGVVTIIVGVCVSSMPSKAAS